MGEDWGHQEEGSSSMWEIIKHKKDQRILKMTDDVEGELSLHHDSNPSTANETVGVVQDIEEYLLKACISLKDQVALKNVHWRNC